MYGIYEQADILKRGSAKIRGLNRAAPAIGCVLPLAALVAFCSSATDTPLPATEKQEAYTEFQGFRLPGNAEDAKKTGFRDCNSDYYAATCTKADASLYGQVTTAHVQMPLVNGKLPADLKALSYDEIEFDFPFGAYASCAASECDAASPTAKLEQRLSQDGWKSWDWRSYRYFVHPGQSVEIAIRLGNQRDGESGVTIRFATPETVQERIAMLSKRDAENASRAADAQKFKADMH